MNKILRISLLIFWMLIIFNFSQTNGEKSSGKSIGIIKNVVVKVGNGLYNIKIINAILLKACFFGNKPLSDKNATTIANNLNYPFRKILHMSEYFILAILFYRVYILYKKKQIYLLTFLSAVLYAISDEFHQLFTGRTGTIVDVLFDSIGILFAIYIINNVKKRKTKDA